jgi:acetyl-CoA acetyltransferase family protein
MPEAVILSTARTPIGRAYKGTLVDVDAFELAQHAVVAALARSGLDPAQVDDMVLAETLYGGGVVARYIAIEAGIEHVPGASVNRHCAAGLTAVTTAAGSIRAGMDRVVIAGGTHSMSTSPRSLRRKIGTNDWADWMSPSHRNTPVAPNLDMSITVGWNAAVEAGVSRSEMDAWAARSHQRAIDGIDKGSFETEIAPIEVQRADGGAMLFTTDEHPRRGTTVDALAKLAPLHPEIEGFSITAGNSSGLNDGAAAIVLSDDATACAQGLEPLAVVRAWASAGVAPERTGLAPTVAIPKALARAGLAIDDVDLWELNEAFASMCVGTCKLLGIDDARVNVLGSGCSLGHPIAMTGARMVITLVHELRRRGGGTGVAAMCAGGGMSTAIVLDVPAPAAGR